MFSRRFRLFVLLGAALAMLAGSVADQVHAVRVVHVVCAEHGEIIELSASARASGGTPGPGWTGATVDHSHDHGCARTLITAPWAATRYHLPVGRSPVGLADLPPATRVPAAATIAFAPKTSPPLAS